MWYNPTDEMPVDDLGYEDIITIATNGQVHEWNIIAWRNAWHTGDAQGRHTWLWTYKPNRQRGGVV